MDQGLQSRVATNDSLLINLLMLINNSKFTVGQMSYVQCEWGHL